MSTPMKVYRGTTAAFGVAVDVQVCAACFRGRALDGSFAPGGEFDVGMAVLFRRAEGVIEVFLFSHKQCDGQVFTIEHRGRGNVLLIQEGGTGHGVLAVERTRSIDELTFADYHDGVMRTVPEPTSTFNDLVHALSGLAEEGGEVVGKLKRLTRGDYEEANALRSNMVSPRFVADIRKEIGDVLWYADWAATQLGTSLAEIAVENNEKLAGRKARGTLKGDGDSR